MLVAEIQGRQAFRRLAAQVKAEGSKDLSREMERALARSTEPVRVSIKAEAEQTMPTRGGYKALFSKSLRWRTTKRAGSQTASYILRTYADGTKERRDVRRLELGQLRHPVFGRSRRLKRGPKAGSIYTNPWAVTQIRPGFHERGTAQAMELAQAELAQVVGEFAQRLIK